MSDTSLVPRLNWIVTTPSPIVRLKLLKLLKELEFHSPLQRHFFPQYLFNFTPAQLCFLCHCIDETKNVAGMIAEVGCAAGATTLFLNKHLDAEGIEKQYYTVDTFSGFVAEDINLEVSQRGKKRNYFTHDFQVNKKKWFDETMRRHHFERVTSIEADVNDFNLKSLGSLSFVLLDVDLYRPMSKCLRELYEILNVGGIMVVDDCSSEDVRWDGANQAYKEFIKEINQPEHIVHGKLGIVRKVR